MPRDHYVAQTYLRRFAGPDGMLRAYRKSDGSTFPCAPRAVCHELDGDIVPEFLPEPGLLGAFRKDSEPFWSGAINALADGSFTVEDKLAVSAYWANLLVCTPTWRRVGVEMYNRMAVDFLSRHQAAAEGMGTADPVLGDALGKLRAGRLKFETKPDYIRALNVASVMRNTWYLYNAEWRVLQNDTMLPYATSDNPAGFDDPGQPTADLPGPPGLVRYLPVSPRLCIACEPGADRIEWIEGADLASPPRAWLKAFEATPAAVRVVNGITARCGEDLVFTGGKDEELQALVAEFARYRVEIEWPEMAGGLAPFIFGRVRTIERPA